MSKMVSVRVPDAIYNQAAILLNELGLSPSALVNAAFEYIVAEGQLPKAKPEPSKTRKRSLSKGDRAKLNELLGACSSSKRSNISSSVEDDKRAIAEARMKKYEALA